MRAPANEGRAVFFEARTNSISNALVEQAPFMGSKNAPYPEMVNAYEPNSGTV